MKHLFFLICATFIFLTFANVNIKAQEEQGLAISPASFQYDRFKPGTEYEQEFTVSRTIADVPATLLITFQESEASKWIEVSPGTEVYMAQGEKVIKLKTILRVPKDASEKRFSVIMRVNLPPFDTSSQVAVVPGLRLDLKFAVSNKNISDWQVNSIYIPDFPKSKDLVLSSRIENKGNISAQPTKIELKIEDANGVYLRTIEATDIGAIAPYSQGDIEAIFKNHDLEVGFYNAEVIIYDGEEIEYQAKTSFNVLEANGIFDINAGTLLMIFGMFMIICAVVVYYFFFGKRRKKKKKNKRNK